MNSVAKYFFPIRFFSACLVPIVLSLTFPVQGQLLRVAVAGMTHDHVHGILQQYKKGEVILVGIAEGNQQLVDRYKKSYPLPDSLFFKDLPGLLKHTRPDVVLAYNAIVDHLSVVETCAPFGISVMVEKPLATTVQQANRIRELALQYNIQVLTNYETTWYGSNHQLFEMVSHNEVGNIRKMVAHDGHQGPKEIGCSADFLSWLTDPEKNGAGALTDFGCYGANLMTWLMNGKAPLSVTAIVRHIKPDIYPRVDDETTILLEYPEATGIIEASWNWPFGIKDLEVFGTSGYLHAMNKNDLERRKKDVYEKVEVRDPFYPDNLIYLTAVLKHKADPDHDLSSLSNNVIVVRILDAARRSAKEGKRIVIN